MPDTDEELELVDETGTPTLSQYENSQVDGFPAMVLGTYVCCQEMQVTGLMSPNSMCTSVGMNSPTTATTKKALVTKKRNPLLSDPPPTPVSRFQMDMESIQVMQSTRHSDLVVRDYVRNEIFPLKKFITTDEELFFNGKMCQKILHALGIPSAIGVHWWNAHKEVVRKTINQKRTAVSTSIKRSFIREYDLFYLCHYLNISAIISFYVATYLQVWYKMAPWIPKTGVLSFQ